MTSSQPSGLPRRFSLQGLHPGNFAMVMATGIIATGLEAHGFLALADLFYQLTLLAWGILLVLSLVRVAKYPRAVRIDLFNPRMVFAYFTLVAATDIVGILLHAHGERQWALACWFFAFAVWCSLLYLAFSVLTFLTHEHNVNIVHGGWLISIVGTQSLVLLGVRVAPELGAYAGYMMVEAYMLWGLGLIFYGIFVTLFCYRIFFLTLRPQDVSPLLWVIMGAAAISANAGTSLLLHDPYLPFLAAQKPFVDGVTMMCWAWATWWIPMLVLFGIWKHGVSRVPLEYEPILWSFVFPLGMYAVASSRLGLAADFPPLQYISLLMIWCAVAAWSFALSGVIRRLWRIRFA